MTNGSVLYSAVRDTSLGHTKPAIKYRIPIKSEDEPMVPTFTERRMIFLGMTNN